MKINSELIEKMMFERLWTQEDLAKASGISRATVSSVTRHGSGARSTVYKIAQALNVDPMELVGRS